MSTKTKLADSPAMRELKEAVRAFSLFMMDSVDDYAFESITIADTPQGVVIQFDASAENGELYKLQIRNLSEEGLDYTASKNNKHTKPWVTYGVRGDQVSLIPHYNRILLALQNLDMVVERLDWSVPAAFTGNMKAKYAQAGEGFRIQLVHTNGDPYGGFA